MADAPTTPVTVASCPNREAMADAAASFVADTLRQSIAMRGHAGLIVTGGHTPGGIYDRLAQSRIAWPRVTVTLTDDRFVPPDDPDSNEGLVRRRLLRAEAAEAKFVPLMHEGVAIEAAALEADRALAKINWPVDLACLGMGEDGHIASLFPGNVSLAAGLNPGTVRRCIAVQAGAPAPPQARLSLTLNALTDARAIAIVTTGAKKRTVFEAAQNGERNDLPIAHLLRAGRALIRFYWAP